MTELVTAALFAAATALGARAASAVTVTRALGDPPTAPPSERKNGQIFTLLDAAVDTLRAVAA